MLTKRQPPSPHLILAIMVCLGLSCGLTEPTFGATLRLINTEPGSGEPGKEGLGFSGDIDLAIVAEVMAGSEGALFQRDSQSPASSFNSSPQNPSQNSLSLPSIFTSLSQLRWEGDGNSGNSFQVPLLPQVEYSDILMGVYDFDPRSTDAEPETDSITFGNGTPSQAVGILLPSVLGRIGTPSNSNSGLPLRVQQGFPLALNDSDGSLSRFLAFLGAFGDLQIDVNFSLLPRANIPTVVNLQAEYQFTNSLTSSNRGSIFGNATRLQQQSQRQQQKDLQNYQRSQQKLQQQIQRQLQAQQRQKQKLQREMERRRREQEKKLIEQYRRQQQQLQRQLERQQRAQGRFVQ